MGRTLGRIVAVLSPPTLEQRGAGTAAGAVAAERVRLRREHLGAFTPRPHPRGLRPVVRFALAALLTAAWVGFSIRVSASWRDDLEDALGPVLAWVIPVVLAYIPGLVIWFMVFTLVLTRYHELPRVPPRGSWPEGEWPAVTILIAAYDEEATIAPTLERIGELDYPGRIVVVVCDNGSTDRTGEVADRAGARLACSYLRVLEPRPGKHHALNAALPRVATPLVVTVDADTYVQRESLTRLVLRACSAPQGQHVAACAAALIAGNPRATFVTRMQEWDYRLGINGVKRMQAAYNSTLVAQGAYSAYDVEDLRAIGGWPDAIGEDIVLTWTVLADRGITLYEPVALGETTVPKTVHALLSQRSRWARGMFEGLRSHPPISQPRILAKLVAGIDYLVPFLDIGMVFFWIPGFVLFLFGHPLIVGWWSMLLFPITLALFGFMRWWQERHVFRVLGVRPGRDVRGFLGYLFAYQALTSAAALRGYAQFLLRSTRHWA